VLSITTRFANRQRAASCPGAVAALISFICTMLYSGMKVVMALRGELGLPCFPAKDASYVDRENIGQDEWMLVLMGLAATAVALVTLAQWIARVPRWFVAAAVWVAGISQAAGAFGMTLRALRILPDLGPGPQGWSTWIVLLVLDAGAITWLVLGYSVTRHGPPASSAPRKTLDR
jgi:hypothetical protein